jgi:hypothetical protein
VTIIGAWGGQLLDSGGQVYSVLVTLARGDAIEKGPV